MSLIYLEPSSVVTSLFTILYQIIFLVLIPRSFQVYKQYHDYKLLLTLLEKINNNNIGLSLLLWVCCQAIVV